MTLANITKASLISQLYNKLGDTDGVFWPEREVILAINETLYLLGSVGNYWKDRISIKTEPNKLFYNLQTDISVNEDLIYNSKTIGDLLEVINFVFKASLSIIDIKEFAINRINEYILQTSINASRHELNILSPNINLVELHKGFLDDIRVAFKGVDNNYNKLSKDEDDNFFRYNEELESDTPQYYSKVLTDSNYISLYPIPTDVGSLEVISIDGVIKDDVINENSKLKIPDNLFYYLKYGVLIDLLLGQEQNPNPALVEYCKIRWAEGIAVGKVYSTVLMAYINGKYVNIDSLFNLDSFDSEWQNIKGEPYSIAIANNNIVIVNRNPNIVIESLQQVYDLSFDIIRNAPVDDEYIRVNDEYIATILDYCYHVLMFKCGFFDISATLKAKDNILSMAYNYNNRIKSSALLYNDLLQVSNKEDSDKSRGV